MTCGARAPSNQLAAAGALRVIIAALATSRASTQTTFKFVATFSSLLFVWFAGDMKSKRPSKDHE